MVISKIVDFKEFQVFEGATTYTCLLFLSKQANLKASIVSIIPQEEHPTSEVFDVAEKELASGIFTDKPWSLSSDSSKAIFDKLSNNAVPLLELSTDISRGSSSGADDVFIVKKIGENTYRTKAGQVIELEPEILRIPLYATDFGRYQYRPKAVERIIFPYNVNSDGYVLKTEEELATKFPQTLSYLIT